MNFPTYLYVWPISLNIWQHVIDLKYSSTTEDMNVHFEEFSMDFASIKEL